MKVTVCDHAPACGENMLSVQINNVAPAVEAGRNQIIYEGDVLTLDPASYTDPGFDNPAMHLAETFTATIAWGDGQSQPAAGIVMTRIPGSPGSPTTGKIKASHQYLTQGTYTVEIAVTDDGRAVATDTLRATVINGRLRFCAYADGTNPGMVIGQGSVLTCQTVPAGPAGEQRASGAGARARASLRDGSRVQGDLRSIENGLELNKTAVVEGNSLASEDTKLSAGAQISGTATSGHDIWLMSKAFIRGNAIAGDKVRLDAGAKVYGTVLQHQSLPPVPNVSRLTMSLSAGTRDVTIATKKKLDLDPGAYGKLTVGDYATVTLRWGQYAFASIVAAKNVTFVFDTGTGSLDPNSIVVDVVGQVRIGNNFIMQGPDAKSPPDPLRVLWRIGGNELSMGRTGQYVGTFVAPNATVQMGDKSTLFGAIYGQKVTFGQNVTISGAPARDLFGILFMTDYQTLAAHRLPAAVTAVEPTAIELTPEEGGELPPRLYLPIIMVGAVTAVEPKPVEPTPEEIGELPPRLYLPIIMAGEQQRIDEGSRIGVRPPR